MIGVEQPADLRVVFERFACDRRMTLLRFAGVLTGNPVVAEDIVQDVLGRAYEKWDRIGGMDNPTAYVRRMIVTDFLGWRRSLRRATPVADVGADLATADPAVDHVERKALFGRLARLPRRQRTVVVLRYYEDLSDASIAEVLGCSRVAVRSYASRALATLRLDLGPARSDYTASLSKDSKEG